ncbi:MAG: glycosyltransferase family 2 protein [Dysgonamonadaceae bacterium]|nr:glycosyltransferase family 2 protein [Dysgonamonadaceae bacterium]
MNVSILYVNYKTACLIVNSIRTIKEHTKDISYEIIVVDNHSEDDSLSMIKTAYPEVICIQSAENLGFGKANNVGLKVARGECILFLNPDTLLINNAVEILYRHLQSSPTIGACGGNLYDENHCPTHSFARHFPTCRQEFFSIFYLPDMNWKVPKSRCFNYTGNPLDVAMIVGADLMIKKTVLEETGAFDPDFFMNGEDVEICYRIRKANYRILSLPDAKIMHLEGRSLYILQSRLHFLYEGNFIYFYKMTGKNGAKNLYRIIQLKNNIRILQFTLLRNKRKQVYWKMKKQTAKEAFRSAEIKLEHSLSTQIYPE